MNRIKTLRQRKGLSQRQLAELIQTSQQQIQRIETGSQAVRFDLAVKLCKVLETPMEVVFPETRKAIDKIRKSSAIEKLYRDEDLTEKMKKAGIDMDPRAWNFKYRLRGGVTGILPVSGTERNRLFLIVQQMDPATPFVIFDSKGSRIALNLKHLTYCHFLFDAPRGKDLDEEEVDVTVILADGGVLSFGVEADDYDPQNKEELGQFGHLLAMAETSVDENDIFSFEDEDGETAFFRAQDIAMIKIPLWVIEPDLLGDEEENE